jgi:hypothetical protein
MNLFTSQVNARHRRAIGIAVLAAIICISSCSSEAPFGGSQWLLTSLQQLTAEGALFDPMRVEQVLHLRLKTSRREGVPQPADCSNSRGNRSLTIVEQSSRPDWLRPTAEGIKDMPIPAFFINMAGVSGDPAFYYTEYEAKACSDRYSLPDTREANLSINGLPALACLKRDDVDKRPGAKPVQATDGVDMIVFEALDNDQKAATLTFVYRAGAPCALSAEIHEWYRLGYRYQRAAAKWATCYDATKHRYCALNGPITWDDGEKLHALEEAAITSCGSLSSYYDKEPVFGPPPPERRHFYNPNGPCPED